MKNLLIALFNFFGLYNSAQSQAALRQLIEASGGDVHEVAQKAHMTVTEKNETSKQKKADAERKLQDAIAAYQKEKADAEALKSDAETLDNESALVQHAARLMGIELTPKADNEQLKKVK